MRKLTIFPILILLTMAVAITSAYADSTKRGVFTAPLTWRADGTGQYKFDENVRVNKASIAKDGSVQTASEEGACELRSSYKTDGVISAISVNFKFTGAVTMEVSTTGEAKDYKPVTNGVPIDSKDLVSGKDLKWRAALAPRSVLSEVEIAYTDLSGVVGSFGSPELSGFAMRKEIFIKGSPKEALYNFQMPIMVGESGIASSPSAPRNDGCDVYLESPSQSDLADIRFTQADGRTPLPYWRERVDGKSPARTALFWIKIPEIPKAGLPIYMYYSCPLADDLSNGEKVFDLFDDFKNGQLDNTKWSIVAEGRTSSVNTRGSVLYIDAARVTTRNYKLASGVIEYKAKLGASGAIIGLIAAARTPESDLAAYSSIIAASAHCIMQDGKVKANDPKQIELNTFYNFRATLKEGEINFQRYGDDWTGAPQAETKYQIGSNRPEAPIGLTPGTLGSGLSCEWIRTRKYADTAPQVDVAKTGKEEATNLPTFRNMALAPDGSLMIGKDARDGEYISSLITSPFEARIITVSLLRGGADSVSSLRAAEGGEAISISVSTKEGGSYYTGWQNGVAKYASKREFTKGNQLRWRAVIARNSSLRGTDPSSSLRGREAAEAISSPHLKKFSLTYQPGTIAVLLPGGGEKIKPGAQYNIFWEALGYDAAYPLDIFYSDDGGAVFQPVASRIANSGSYAWAVPEAESAKVMIKVADSLDKGVYGLSGNVFMITALAGDVVSQESEEEDGEAGGEAETVSKKVPPDSLKTNEGSIADGAKLYELLVKPGSAPARSGKARKASADIFQAGDIVAIRPAGFLWGASERMNFIIVQAYLTDEDVEELTRPQEDARVTGKGVRPIKKMRKHKIDFTNKDAGDKFKAKKAIIEK